MADLDEAVMQQDAGGQGERWNSLDKISGQGAAGAILNASSAAYNNAGNSGFSGGDFGSGGDIFSGSFSSPTSFSGDGGYGLSYNPYTSNSGGYGDMSFNDNFSSGFNDLFGGSNDFANDYGSSMSEGSPYVLSSSDSQNLYGNDAYGEKDNSYNGNDLLKKYRDAVSPLQGILKNPIISTLMSLNPYSAVLKAALGGPTSVGGFLGSMFGGRLGPLGGLAGGLAGSQGANYATDGVFSPMSNSSIGGVLGAGAGILSGNPYGAMFGGQAGSQLGNMFTNNSFAPGETSGIPNGGGGGMGMGSNPGYVGNYNLGGAGGNLLTTGMNNTGLGAGATLGMGLNNNRMIGNQVKNLEGLFGQNSSYAQAMRQQLERRDAASGRRSQYGPREVELQAALAKNASGLAPSLNQLYSQKMGNTNLMVQSLLRNPNLTQGMQQGWNGLKGLFEQPQPDPFSNGGFQSGNEGMGD